MNRSKKLVIFDMDGTLIDSSHTIANAINYVRAHQGLSPMPYEHIISHVNDHTINPARFFYDIDRFEPIHEELFSKYYANHHDKELVLYDGIMDLLEWLHDKGIKLAVATNAYRSSTIHSLEHFGILDLFDDVVCADDIDNGKPAPDMLYKVLEDLHLSVEDAVFVGDGPRDEEAALAAGMDYLMVDWGFSDHKGKSDLIHTVEQLRNKLKQMLDADEP